jgi:lipoprotein-releasing system permease protein
MNPEPPFPVEPAGEVGRWQVLLARFRSSEGLAGVWDGLSGGERLVVICTGVALVLLGFGLLIRWLRRLSQVGRRRVLWLLTLGSGGGAVFLGRKAASFASRQGGFFRVDEQLTRGATALLVTLFIFCLMLLLLPVVLDVVERSGFIGFVSARHVRAGKSGVLTVISTLSIFGVGLSSFAMCAVVSVMGGFGADLRAKILNNNANIYIDAETVGGFDAEKLLGEVRLVDGVAAATGVAGGEAMASSRSNTAGVLVRGVDLETVESVVSIFDKIEIGKVDYLRFPEKLLELPADEVIWISKSGHPHLYGPRYEPIDDVDPEVRAVVRGDEFPAVIIGKELAKSLHVYLGDVITLVAPLGDLTPAGVMPRTRKFIIAGIFFTGMFEYDSSQAYMRLADAQEFLDLNSNVTSVEVKVKEPERVGPVTERVTALTAGSGLRTRDWKEMNKSLFSALELEKVVTFIILVIAIVVASFCIVCTLLLMVTEKSKEIAILKSLGASDGAILKTFLAEGLTIGAIGTAFGVVSGYIACFSLKKLGVQLDPDIWYVERLPVEVNIADYGLIAFAALGITMLATVYPALAAANLRPVDGIRYE